MKPYIKEMRIKSWLKNVFIFIPLVFSLELLHTSALLNTLVAFTAFCLVSSAIYLFNDICDADKDALHPVKQTRPIASGTISKRKAAIFAILLVSIGLAAGFAAGYLTGILIAAYIVLNLLYSLWLKHQCVFDVFSIAAGFVLRIYAGGAASGAPVSDWLFLTVVAMSLFMAFGKRRGELLNVEDHNRRDVLLWYDAKFLSGMIFICAGLAVVFYALWAMSRGKNMIYTVPLIVFILSKYLLLLHYKGSHGDPTTVILEDKVLLFACGIYALITVALLYFGKAV